MWNEMMEGDEPQCISVCVPDSLSYDHLMVPEGWTAVSAAIQTACTSGLRQPILFTWTHLKEKLNDAACKGTGAAEKKYEGVREKRRDGSHTEWEGVWIKGKMKLRTRTQVAKLKTVDEMKVIRMTRLRYSINTLWVSHSVWSSHNLISPMVQQHVFPTLSDSFYIIRATWPTISFCASSLTQLSHLRHSASFMSKNHEAERGKREKQSYDTLTPNIYSCLLLMSNK